MKYFLITLLVSVASILNPLSIKAEEVIRVTLQLPESHSLVQNWLSFKSIVEKKSGGDL